MKQSPPVSSQASFPRPSFSRHCLHLLRQGDYDRYFALLFAPVSKRVALAALYAFHLEIARIGDVVKEPLVGEIRLRWWADQIEAIKDAGLLQEGQNQENGQERGEGNPLLGALAFALAQFDLPTKPLLAAIDARIADLYPHEFATRQDFELYCGQTASVFFQLACQILDPVHSRKAADASGHAGVAETLCRMLSRFGHGLVDIAQIPRDLLSALGFDAIDSDLLLKDDAACTHLASALLAYAGEHYDAFCCASKELPSSLRPAFLSLSSLPVTLNMLEKRGVGVFKIPTCLSPLRRQWMMTRTALVGNFGN